MGKSNNKLVFRFFNIKSKKSGTTFIELLIVLFIIAIFSGIILLNWRQGEKEYSLERAAVKMVQTVRRAENLSMSTKNFNGQIPKAYGIYFTTTPTEAGAYHYILFADLNGDGRYTSTLDGIVEDIPIEQDIKIYQILPGSPITIAFFPPDPTVKITQEQNQIQDNSQAQITLSLVLDQTRTKKIIVNKAGLVYVANQ